MYLPPSGSSTSSNTKKEDILNFFGYDQREKIDDRQMSEMYNMSSDSIPAASPRKPREHIVSLNGISAVTAPERPQSRKQLAAVLYKPSHKKCRACPQYA